MIIKKIAKKNNFDCDDFERYLIEVEGVAPVKKLRNYDLEDGRVDEIISSYKKYLANGKKKPVEEKAPVIPSRSENLKSSTAQNDMTTYLYLETPEGFSVRIRADRAAAWKEAQEKRIKEDGPKDLAAMSKDVLSHLPENYDEEARDLIIKNQVFDETYGRIAANPVCADSYQDGNNFLIKLYSIDGNKIYWVNTETKEVDLHTGKATTVEVYDLYDNWYFIGRLFLCPYAKQSRGVPEGMTLGSNEGTEHCGGNIKVLAENANMSIEGFISFQQLFRDNKILLQKQEKEIARRRDNIPLYCRKCGKKIPSDSIFCNYCGTEVVCFEDDDIESNPQNKVYNQKWCSQKETFKLE